MSRSRPTVLVLLLAAFLVAATPALAPAAEDHPAKQAEPNILEPRLDLTIWTIVVFGVLLLVLRKFAWGPMLEGLQGRAARIRGALEEAQLARDEAQKLREQLQAEMAKIHDKMREMLDEARRDGQALKERMVAEGKAEIQAEGERKRREIQLEKEQAIQELWNQTARLATLVSAKAIRRSLNEADHRSLVDEAVAELRHAATGRATA